MITVGVKSDVGIKRDNNQDSFYISENNNILIYLVADGMGGHKAGKLASTMARDIIQRNFNEEEIDLDNEANILKKIKMSIEEANTKIYLKSIEDEEFKGMGTTVTMAYIFENKIYLGHVGDSRAYLIKRDEIIQITEDHSYVNQLLKSGSITKKEAKSHPKRNMITRAVGSSSIIEIDLIVKEWDQEDILILSSDGLTNMVKDYKILKAFKDEDNIQKSCDKLVHIANKNGGIDNITVIAIKFN